MRSECDNCKLSPQDMLKCEVVDKLTDEQMNDKKLRCNRRGKWKDVPSCYSRSNGTQPPKNESKK